jgi:prepilin-type N-terminal cleavage/methylation domain-containing protein
MARGNGVTPPRSRLLRDEGGFTLIELLVAIFILLVGLLGVVTMIVRANTETSRTKAREGATSLGRTVVEISRGIPYEDLDGASVIATLQAKPGLDDVDTGTAGHQIASRNFRYTVAVTTCSLDDPRDGLGEHDAPVTYCADTDTLPAGDPVHDRNPDDYKRVAVALTWRPSQGTSTRTVRQTGLIPNPVGGLGPSVVALDPTAPNSLVLNQANSGSSGIASYRATTSRTPAEVSWSINGVRQGTATGAGTVWNFDWNLAATRGDGSLKYPDCTYIVEAEAFDDKGRAGTPKALTVTLNRMRPVEPSGFNGGRNGNGNRVDLEWVPNPECDVLGYRVYRQVNGTGEALVCDSVGGDPNDTTCIDEPGPAPASGLAEYRVVAVDKDDGGAVVEGNSTPWLPIVEGNPPPTSPTNLVGCIGGVPGCNDIDGNPAGTDSPVLTWDAASDPGGFSAGILYYRIYRDGVTYGDRYDVFYPAAGKPLVWIDSKPGSGGHSYYVSAVDTLYGESPLIGPVSP